MKIVRMSRTPSFQPPPLGGDDAAAGLRGAAERQAVAVLILSMTGCAEIEVSAEVYKTLAQTNEQPPAPPVVPDPARQDSIDPSMRPDPGAFYAADLALWDGARTLPGIWIAHPMAETARRVRLTNGETGARVDAAMFKRDPNLSGPRIVVSSERSISSTSAC